MWLSAIFPLKCVKHSVSVHHVFKLVLMLISGSFMALTSDRQTNSVVICWIKTITITVEADYKKSTERRCVYCRVTSPWEREEWAMPWQCWWKRQVQWIDFKTDRIPIWDSTRSTDSDSHRDVSHETPGQRVYPQFYCGRREMMCDVQDHQLTSP